MQGKTIRTLALATGLAAAGGAPVWGPLGDPAIAQGTVVDSKAKPGAADGAVDAAAQEAAFQLWLAGFRERALAAGISEAVLDRDLAGLRLDPSILERDRNQAEHTRQLWDYLDRAVSADRIANGKAALAKHGALLRQIEAKYAVEAEVVAAVWGLETAYGTFRGSLPVVSSLATLAFDARRSAYFERELIEALKILQAGHVDPAEFKGSWAGASGHTQFMPSSFWRSAVDWTGDGRRNLWGEDPADALASAAAYLAKSGWVKGLPWGLEVALPSNFPWEQSGERIKKPLSEWRALGVSSVTGGEAGAGLPGETMASVLVPAGHEGTAFLIFKNFQVIETYNTADAYVIAIGTLSDQLAGRAAIEGNWPRGDLAMSGAEKKELQQLLLDRGFDPKGVDGVMGPNTIQAVRDYQKSEGLVPDGYASLRLIERLRSQAVAGREDSAETGAPAGAVGSGMSGGAAAGSPGAASDSGDAQAQEGTAPSEGGAKADIGAGGEAGGVALRPVPAPGRTPRPPGRSEVK